MNSLLKHVWRFFCLALLWSALWLGLGATPAFAANCGPATTQGTAPAGWETYCWLDFTSYNDATARSGAGQNMSFTLHDGSVLTLNVKTTTTTATAFNAIVAPSWSGAAVGNTAFLGIPGKPVLYTTAAGAKTIVFSGITITPPSGSVGVTAYAFVAADAESTNQGENLQVITNGGNWTILDQVNPISGNTYPAISGVGTNTFTETGAAGTVGGYIVASDSPTTVTVNIQAGGLQGAMFAIRFASIKLFKQIIGARINPADQFQFGVQATASGAVLAAGTTSGTGNGPFSAAAVSLASGLNVSVSESMASGSVSPLAQYSSRLTCTNATSSSTALPNNVLATSYNLGTLQFGDTVQCTFTNAAYPRVRLIKALGSNRRFSTDQFTVRIMQGAAVAASTTTTGTTNVVTAGTGDTGMVQLNAGTAYTLGEIMSGPGSLLNYSSVMGCSNGTNGVTTSFPTTVPGSITPVLGDVITCTITNTRLPASARLVATKTSAVLSDGVNLTNPKALPGARIQYTITVSNSGSTAVDANSIIITDPFPPQFVLDASTPITMNLGNSGLNAFNQGTMVTYSSQAGGGAPYTAPLGSGYNSALTGLRFQPTGTMAAATAAGPSAFSFTFTGRMN